MSDLSQKFTAIISDLHLSEAEPLHPKFPLWKKYKTSEFFFDDVFADFLLHIEKKSKGKPIELILNGDVFDFDSVTETPTAPSFKMSWLERRRGLNPLEYKSQFKISVILRDHKKFFVALSEFIQRGHEVVFIIGNHDLELHYENVQKTIVNFLELKDEYKNQIRFCEWFYISNADTLVEHGNQYDPYCLCEDPIHPFIMGYNYYSIRLPFGNLASRYIMNGLGFFNPHVDSNYIMSLKQYVNFFLKYMARAQPLLILTWFGGAVVTLYYSFKDRLRMPFKDPLKVEDRVNEIAKKSNSDPRMVRELRELFVEPAASDPFLILRELWLDRAFLIMIAFYVIFLGMILIKQAFDVSFFWAFIPLFFLLPFFLFYSQSIISHVETFKEPDEKILNISSSIAKVQRVVYGHTHIPRHQIIGSVEHLNSGCWSPAFLDVECTKPIDQKNFVWISPGPEGIRAAELLSFKKDKNKIK